jgi:hypothetical protein
MTVKTHRKKRAARLPWYLLIHQVPPKPLYLRAKIRQRLDRVGAVPLKQSVYALPRLEECLEDFQWIAEQVVAGGGEAHICEAEFPDRRTDVALVQRFRADREKEYREIHRSIGAARRSENDSPERLARARKRFDEVAKIDFFQAKGRREADMKLQELERRARPASGASKPRPRGLAGRTWVTRRGVKVDRIASAWLIRRFLDARARFRFVDPKAEQPRAGELRFDMVGGDFTHEGDRCTFETLLARTRVRDPALRGIAEIVHDIDVKDGKFARPEAAGIEQVLSGLLRSSAEDEARLQRGFALFDELYESFRGSKPVSRLPKK